MRAQGSGEIDFDGELGWRRHRCAPNDRPECDCGHPRCSVCSDTSVRLLGAAGRGIDCPKVCVSLRDVSVPWAVPRIAFNQWSEFPPFACCCTAASHCARKVLLDRRPAFVSMRCTLAAHFPSSIHVRCPCAAPIGLPVPLWISEHPKSPDWPSSTFSARHAVTGAHTLPLEVNVGAWGRFPAVIYSHFPASAPSREWWWRVAVDRRHFSCWQQHVRRLGPTVYHRVYTFGGAPWASTELPIGSLGSSCACSWFCHGACRVRLLHSQRLATLRSAYITDLHLYITDTTSVGFSSRLSFFSRRHQFFSAPVCAFPLAKRTPTPIPLPPRAFVLNLICRCFSAECKLHRVSLAGA